MAMRFRFLHRLKGRLSSEAGFAVPTVTLMMVAALGMAGLAVSTSIQGQGGTVRDQRTKSALGIAESGVEQALLRYNRYGLVPDAAPCAPVGGSVPQADGWCPEVSTTVNGYPVNYRVRPESTLMPSGDIAWTEIEVVSTGSLAGVTRRVDLIATSSAGQDIFAKASVKSEDWIKLEPNTEIHAGSATNGDLILEGTAKQCGTATVGIGKDQTGSGGGYFTDINCGTAGGDPAQQEIDLPPVNQKDAATVNNNYRLFTEDQICCKANLKKAACFDGHNGNGAPDASCGDRELVVGNNASVTLGGTVYSFCKVTLKSNSSLYVAPPPGKKTTIYFDSPEACGYDEEPVLQIDLSSNSRITPVSGQSESVALLFVGSKEIETKVVLSSNTELDDPVLCSQNFVVYGPYTDVELKSETSFCGAMAAKTVHLKQNSEIWTSSGVANFFLPLVAPHYEPSRFVDCSTAAPIGIPDEGC